MSLVDLLVTILVATILITVGIGLVTYLVYKLRYSRVRSDGDDAGSGEEGRYFTDYPPPAEDGDEEEGEETVAEEAAPAEPHGS